VKSAREARLSGMVILPGKSGLYLTMARQA